MTEDATNRRGVARSWRQTGGFWRACSAARNAIRSWLNRPSTLWQRQRNPWERLADQHQFESLFNRYPVHPVRAEGITLGVLKGFDDTWQHYARACHELNVGYQEINLTTHDWLRRVENSDCDGFIAHPLPRTIPWKTMFEERLFVIGRDLQKPLHPGLAELWLYESKRRMAYWLEAHDIPHAPTMIFYDLDDAMAYAAAADYPMVCKTDLGSSADGVTLVRSRAQAYRLIAKAFAGGLAGRARDPRDREWGTILFQQYIAKAREFRVIQIGDAWFAHEKAAHEQTGFHSGSGRSKWNIPSFDVFDFCRSISQQGGFRSMNYDVLVDKNERCFVNELQAMFAAYNPSQMYREGVPGRMICDESGWRFQEGLFCRNRCANPRVEMLVEEIRERKCLSGEPFRGDAGSRGR